MSEAPLMPAPKTPKDNTDRDIARLVNAGLMPRNKLPLLRAARKNLERKGDIAMIPRMQRRAIQDYQNALQTAVYKTTGSVGAVRRNIGEETELNEEVFSAPQMLVLRRTGIRIFPDGRRVALYVNDKHNLVFSVPYSRNLGAEMPMVQAEEFVLENIEQLAEVKEGEVKKVKVGDESIDIGHQTAIDILNLHSKLNDQNKKLMQKHIKDPQQFKKIVKLATKTK